VDAELFDSLQGESASERNPAVSAEKVVRQVVDEIIEQLKRGTAPWVRPWTNVTSGPRGAMPYNGLSGRPYNGGNVLALWIAQMARGFTSAEWLTRRQAKAMGGSVQPGQAGTAILFFKLFEVPESQRDGEEDDGRRAIVKTFTVFNRDQCSGLPDSKWTVPVTKPKGKGAAKGRVPAADAAIAATGAKIVYGGNRAFYSTATDSIMVPEFAQFKAAERFYSTSFHELGHWTGAPARLARKFGKKFGDDAYAFEELIAELTSAFCCATFGITSQLQHAEYIASWIKQLQADPNVLFRAAGAAEKAYQWIVPPAKPVKQNPGERLPKGFEGWRLDDVVQGVDRGTHKKAPIYVVRSPRGATGILVPTDGVYRFHEQLDLFPDSRPAPAGQGSLFSRNPASPVSLPDETDDYRISSAKYAKGMSALRIPSTDGYVHRADRLAKALKAKWSNREYAFILSPSKASKFKQLFVDGWDANGFNYELEAPAKPAVAPAVEAAKPSPSVAGGRARRQAVDRASPGPILTGQVHPERLAQLNVNTFGAGAPGLLSGGLTEKQQWYQAIAAPLNEATHTMADMLPAWQKIIDLE
jgi:antirestriction protein ArdC